MERAHPITIVQKMYKRAALLLIPIMRGAYHIFSSEPRAFASWLSGAWLDIALLSVIIVMSVMNWRCIRYKTGEDGILVRQGIFIKSEKVIRRRFITSVTCHRPAVMRLMKAENVYVDTEGGYTRHSDMSITVKCSETRRFCEIPPGGKTYRPRLFEILFLSLCVTDTLTSTVYAVLIINRAGKIIGRDIITEFIGYISRAAVYIAMALLAAEILGILRNFLYFSRFSVIRSGGSIYFENGFFSRTRSFCRVSALNYIDKRQNLISSVFGLNMIFIQCTGYGKARKKEALLIPAASERSARECIKMLIPELYSCAPEKGRFTKPSPRSFMRYVRTPVLAAALLIIAGMLLISFVITPYFPQLGELARFTVFMLVVPLALFAVVRVTAFGKAGIFYEGGGGLVTLCYYKGMNIHTVTFRACKISHIKIKQSILQARFNICDVIVYTGGEGGHRHAVIGVKRDDKLISDIENRL